MFDANEEYFCVLLYLEFPGHRVSTHSLRISHQINNKQKFSDAGLKNKLGESNKTWSWELDLKSVVHQCASINTLTDNFPLDMSKHSFTFIYLFLCHFFWSLFIFWWLCHQLFLNLRWFTRMFNLDSKQAEKLRTVCM